MNRVCTTIGVGTDPLSQVVEDLEVKLAGDDPLLICIFAAIEHELQAVLRAHRERWPNAAVVGCSSAGEFTEAREAKKSIAVFALAGDFSVRTGFASGLRADPLGAIQKATEHMPIALDDYPERTAIMLIDPFAGNGEEATLMAAEHLGVSVPLRLVGGAAGDDLSMTRAFVGAGEEASSDAVAMAMVYSKVPLGIGVQHGHRALSGPLTVTKAQGNVVHELDGRPAWDVWRDQTRAAAALRGVDVDALGEDAIGGFLLTYEAALSAGDSLKVRAPLVKHDDGSLSFACGIPQGAVIRITQSGPDAQVDSARKAAELAREQLAGRDVAGALVFDCICRNLILDEAFSTAVSAISESLGDVPLAGFETYGEIALEASDMSGFHNTTTVVLAVPQ